MHARAVEDAEYYFKDLFQQIQNQYKDVPRLDIDILLFGSDDLSEEDNMYIYIYT